MYTTATTMATSSSSGTTEPTFPAGALVPKAETGVLNFRQKYPDYDGRDVVIAIFDSGVDPRASGLETLCDGKSVKVIERFDCSGCGDVDVTKKVTADAKGYITGLSGRQLKLTPEMIASNTAKGEFRIGLKNFYDLCPSKVRENIINYVKSKEWDGPHKVAIADVLRKINELEPHNCGCLRNQKNNEDAAKPSWDKKLVKDDLDSILEMLNNYDKLYKDIKISYDCILYPTEDGWQAVIDTTENGDLEKALHIGEYSKTHEMKNVDNYLSISINVHDNGKLLEIVGMCSSHGTHVASIASGNHSSLDTDGVAPNAKIVSLMIGDGRLGSMETGTGLVRAMSKVMELCRSGTQVDVINMSYGEHAHWSNSGRVGELMNEVVNKYGVCFVVSGGNHGPALSTVGTPPDISQPSCIGVGAYVSPQMMEADYVMREKLPGNVYTWTSRNPCIDGGLAITICAPGGAITSVPQFTMTKSFLMNGTSMAAPHVAGAIALLISGLKQKGITYSPYSIKRAISNTATKLGYVDSFAQGNGLLNIEKAFDYLVQHSNASENMLRFSVRCGPNNAKGIYLRDGVLQKPSEYNVTIEPVFMNDKEVDPHKKFNFNIRVNLAPSQPFVQCGAFVDLSYTSRNLFVKVDPSGLKPGVHEAVIRAYDTACVDKGSLFEIPVTVVQPHTVNCEESRVFEPISNSSDGSIEFQPNTIQRDFILVPKQATCAVLRMRSTDKNRDKEIGKFFIHTMQLLPKSSCRVLETMKFLSVNAENETTLVFKCQENNILELCIAKYWSNYGTTHLKYSLEFHGIEAINYNAYVMHAARGIHRMDITSLIFEELQPQIQLKTAAVVLKPTETKITPLSATRDVIPEGRQIYQNLLTYTINLPKPQEIALYAPIFNAVLYESEFESQLWMLFDSNKVMVACGDAHSHKFYTKLEKGEYTVKLQVRHEKRDMLEKISEATMVALLKLANTISFDVYDDYNQCVVGQRKFTSCVVKDNQVKVLYLAPLPQEKLTKANLPGNCAWLSGTVSLAKDETLRRVDVEDFMYILNPVESKRNGNGGSSSSSNSSTALVNGSKSKTNVAATTSAASATSATAAPGDVSVTPTPSTTDISINKNKTSLDEYVEGLRDFQCSMITKCELEKAYKIHEEVIAAHPKHLTAHILLIQNIESTELKAQLPLTFVKSITAEDSDDKQKEDPEKMRASLGRVIELADVVIKETDKDGLLAYYGLKNDSRPDAAKIKTNMDKQKSNLLEALTKKGIAIAKLGIIDDKLSERLVDLDNIHTEIIKYVDASDSKVMQFSLWHAYAHRQCGRMYKCLQKLYDDKHSRDILEELNLVAGALNYGHLQTAIQRMTISAHPNGFRLF